MKKISEHLGQIIVALAGVALLIAACVVFRAPIGDFYHSIVGKETSIGDTVLAGVDDPNLSDLSRPKLEGDGQTFHKLAPTALSFRSTAPLSEFQEVQVNGATVDPAHYTLTEGSTIVTLSIDYLSTLDVDAHEITVVSDSGSPSAGFSVVSPDVNAHGFYYNQPYAAYVNALGCKVAFFVREDGTFDSITEDGGTETGTYEISLNSIVSNNSMGTLNSTISADGTEIYCTQLATAFVLGDESFAADEDYIYSYDSSLGGYVVKCIDRAQSSYAPIRTGINGYPTVSVSRTFANCINLKSIPLIPTSVTTIGSCAFSGCDSLTAVIIPDGITTIHNAFIGCHNLTSVTIPDSVTSIDGAAFSNCTSLTKVALGSGVTNIGERAFAFVTSMTAITIPDSVTNIGDVAFGDCTSLTSITFEGTVAQWNAIPKGIFWNNRVPATEVVCSDGTVALS